MKFGALLRQLTRGSEVLWLATGMWLTHLQSYCLIIRAGHYARKDWQECTRAHSIRPRLLRARDATKDQTYYLSSIPENGLSRALFPLGELQKTQVRRLATESGLPTAVKEESMGICFVGERRKFSDFLCKCCASVCVFF